MGKEKRGKAKLSVSMQILNKINQKINWNKNIKYDIIDITVEFERKL